MLPPRPCTPCPGFARSRDRRLSVATAPTSLPSSTKHSTTPAVFAAPLLGLRAGRQPEGARVSAGALLPGNQRSGTLSTLIRRFSLPVLCAGYVWAMHYPSEQRHGQVVPPRFARPPDQATEHGYLPSGRVASRSFQPSRRVARRSFQPSRRVARRSFWPSRRVASCGWGLGGTRSSVETCGGSSSRVRVRNAGFRIQEESTCAACAACICASMY